MNSVTRRVVPSQGMKVKAREVHILGGVEPVQPPQDPFVEPGVYPGLSRLPQGSERLAGKRLDYIII